MGTSHPETKPWIMAKVKSLNIKSILDVGAGAGNYAEWLAKSGYAGDLDAVEVWQPYIDKYMLHSKYDNVYTVDVREWDSFKYDLVILGDVLEHMTKQDALDVWATIAMQAKYAVIAIPIVHYHQGELDGNPYEVHVKEDWTHEEVLDTFPGIIDSWEGNITGAYWASFE